MWHIAHKGPGQWNLQATALQLLTPAQQQKNQLGEKEEAWTHSETLTLLAARLGAILLSAANNERCLSCWEIMKNIMDSKPHVNHAKDCAQGICTWEVIILRCKHLLFGKGKKVEKKNENRKTRPLYSSHRKEMLVGSESFVKGCRDFTGNG